MCFSSPKLPKAKPPATITPISAPPIQEQLPQTQTGADIANTKKKPRVKSPFQIDLTGPLDSVGPASTTTGVGPA